MCVSVTGEPGESMTHMLFQTSVTLFFHVTKEIVKKVIVHIQSWSELLAPLVNMIKEGSENKPALLILLIFY